MGVNKVILVGNLGRDPELRYTNSQTPVCNFSLATGERRKDASGNWVDHTEWHNIIAFGRTAENCSNFLKKGRQVYIEGKIQTRKWQDKEGHDRYTTEVLANTVQFLGGREGTGRSDGMDAAAPASANEALQALETADSIANGGGAAAAVGGGGDVSFDDDDIPF